MDSNSLSKIGDFGLCRIIHSSESHTSSLTTRAGTGDYMAPEVFTNDYSLKADLYSLGLVFWEVFQRLPFHQRRNLFDRLVNDKEEDLVKPVQKMENVQELIVNLTKKRILDRIQDVDQVALILERVRLSLGDFATNSEEFMTCLKNVKKGGVITLAPGVYKGEFILQSDDVVIRGDGGGSTVLSTYWTCFSVTGSGCSISNITMGASVGSMKDGIHLRGSQNSIKDVEISGAETCIRVIGGDNKLERLSISNAKYGIVICQGSCNNKVNHVEMSSIKSHGIVMDQSSNQNVIQNVTGSNVRTGIVVHGSNNTLSDIHLSKDPENQKTFVGAWLLSGGSRNTIYNLSCSGCSKDSKDWGLLINSSNTSVDDSDCGPVWVGHGKNVTFSKVNCGDLIDVEDTAEGVTMKECWGQNLSAKAAVTTINCKFATKIKVSETRNAIQTTWPWDCDSDLERWKVVLYK